MPAIRKAPPSTGSVWFSMAVPGRFGVHWKNPVIRPAELRIGCAIAFTFTPVVASVTNAGLSSL